MYRRAWDDNIIEVPSIPSLEHFALIDLRQLLRATKSQRLMLTMRSYITRRSSRRPSPIATSSIIAAGRFALASRLQESPRHTLFAIIQSSFQDSLKRRASFGNSFRLKDSSQDSFSKTMLFLVAGLSALVITSLKFPRAPSSSTVLWYLSPISYSIHCWTMI